MVTKGCLIVKPAQVAIDKIVTMSSECCSSVQPELVGIEGIEQVTKTCIGIQASGYKVD